jgi:hypothetical protein
MAGDLLFQEVVSSASKGPFALHFVDSETDAGADVQVLSFLGAIYACDCCCIADVTTFASCSLSLLAVTVAVSPMLPRLLLLRVIDGL